MINTSKIMDLHEQLQYGLLPTYEQMKNGILKLIDDGKLSREDAALVLPELKENEDERTRKEMIKYLGNVRSSVSMVCGDQPEGKRCVDQMNRYISYLEKQKEQKPNIELIQRSWYMEGYHDGKFKQEPKWILKTGEGGTHYEPNPRYGQPLDEQKPAEFTPNQFDGIVYGMEGHSTNKPAEWSEEDEENLELVTDCIYKFYPDPVMKYKLKDWLKDLPNRIALQPNWKPSEEQMCELNWASKLSPVLESLYNYLKKL